MLNSLEVPDLAMEVPNSTFSAAWEQRTLDNNRRRLVRLVWVAEETLIAFVVLHGLQNASLQCCTAFVMLHSLQNASSQCCTACRSHGEQTLIAVPHRFPCCQGRKNCICVWAYMCAGTYRQREIHRLANDIEGPRALIGIPHINKNPDKVQTRACSYVSHTLMAGKGVDYIPMLSATFRHRAWMQS